MTTANYQSGHDGPLTKEAIDYLHSVRTKNGWSYERLANALGISGAFTHNLLNKNMNISTNTYMKKVAAGIEALKATGGVGEKSETNVRVLDHAFHLRDSLQVTFKLPVDLTEREAERLGNFIRSLAI